MKAKEFLAAAAAVMIAAVGSGSVLMSLTAMDTEAASTSKPATLTTARVRLASGQKALTGSL